MKTKKPGFYMSELLRASRELCWFYAIKDPNAFHLSTWLSSVSDIILPLRVKGGTAVSGVTLTPEVPGP